MSSDSAANGNAGEAPSQIGAAPPTGPPPSGAGLTRRSMLTATFGAALGAAGAKVAPSLAAVDKPRPTTLWPAEADVWALSIDVEGTPAGASLSLDGQPIASTPEPPGFTAVVPLEPGENTLLATGPGTGRQVSRIYTARVEDRPTARIALRIAEGSVVLDASGSEPDPYAGAPIESCEWRLRDGTPLGSGLALTLRGPWRDGEHYVTARVATSSASSDESTVVFVVSGGVPEAVETQSWQPQWVENAVVYGAIPPLFGEPPLQALEAQLDRLAALGVTVLWLSPIFATTPGEFGYGVSDYFTVRPEYGDLAALQSLVAAAHERGLKVILDLPLNDTSSRHPYFQQAKEDTTGSHYWDFYQRSDSGRPVHYFNWHNLPNLNYSSVEVRRMATQIASYWLREADVDGFRCDAAWGVQERSPDFWAGWRAELQRIRPDLLLLAEASAREPVWSATGFSAAYDWTNELGAWAWEAAFTRKATTAPALHSILQAPGGSRPFRFLENNDTGLRFITRHGPEMTRAASSLLLSLPGIPCIYTGQEIGASYLPYSRTKPLDWASDPDEMEPFYRRLIEERLASDGLGVASLTPLEATPAEQILAYLVSSAVSSTLVAINFSSQSVSSRIQTGKGERALLVPAWSAMKVAIA